jgi:hypothetical protein
LKSTSEMQDSLTAPSQLSRLVRKAPSGAVFSPDRTYRYVLWRTWAEAGPLVLFVGLNPSTADENSNDPTIRRCLGFARQQSARGVIVSNLFAYRATLPRDLFACREPVGPEADAWLQAASDLADRTVACWGAHGAFRGRSHIVLPLLNAPFCLGITKHGEPRHPLYLKGSTELQPIKPPKRDA